MKNSLTILGLFAAVAATGCSTAADVQRAQWNFAIARAETVSLNGIPAMACTGLKNTMHIMIDGNLSYADIGTTKEKFEMIRDYNGCKFNP